MGLEAVTMSETAMLLENDGNLGKLHFWKL